MSIALTPPSRQNPFVAGGGDWIHSLSRKSWNHVFQYLSPAERGRFAQVCKWNAHCFSPLRCMLSEQVDSQGLQQWRNVVELELEHPLNTSAQRAGAALFISAVKGDGLFVRKLLSTRPDIRSSDKEKALLMASIYGQHHIVREILIHRYPGLSNCNIHEIMDILFPLQTESATLPNRPAVARIYDELIKITEMEEEEVSLYRQMDSSEQSQIRTWILRFFAKNHYLASPWNLNFTLTTMSTVHPLFAKAWEIANRHQRVEVREVKKEESDVQGSSNIHAKGQYACYDSTTHQIEVDRESAPTLKVELLFFETMNALQRGIFQTIFDLANAGELSREEYASLIELVECRSGAWRTRMLNYMREYSTPILSFHEVWKHVNQPFFPGGVPHAYHYRKIWDIGYFGRFLQNHRGLIFSQASQTPSSFLYQAAAEGDVSEVIDLLRKHLDLGEWDSVGVALSAAAENGHLEVVEHMLHLRKDLSVESVGIALCNAARHRHWQIVRHLLKERPGFNSVDVRYVLGKADETQDLLLIQDLRKILAHQSVHIEQMEQGSMAQVHSPDSNSR